MQGFPRSNLARFVPLPKIQTLYPRTKIVTEPANCDEKDEARTDSNELLVTSPGKHYEDEHMMVAGKWKLELMEKGKERKNTTLLGRKVLNPWL